MVNCRDIIFSVSVNREVSGKANKFLMSDLRCPSSSKLGYAADLGDFMGEIFPLLELLENVGLVNGSRINERRVMRLSAGQLSDLGAEAAAITKAEELERESGSLAHSATLSLGGGTQPCINVSCRIHQVDQLAQFAAFYSDRVYIHNFLGKYEHESHSGYAHSLEERRHALLDDLQVIVRIRPLIEAGMIILVTPTREVCSQCIALGAFGIDADKRLIRERRRLTRQYFEEMSVEFAYNGEAWEIRCEAPEELLEHGSVSYFYEEPPEPLCNMPRILQHALQGKFVRLSRDARRKLREHEDAANRVFGSVVFEMAVSQVLGTSYLSDTKLPIKVLSAISGDADLARRNSLVQKHLTSLVPFFGEMPAASVLKLRQREEESFLTYRQALNKAIDDVRAQRSDFSERDARSIYSDVVAPELARLERSVKTARREILKDVGRSILGWSAAISFGMYAGLLPEQLLLAAKALGLTKVLADIGAATGKLASPEDAIRKENLFFLWKVRQLSERRRYSIS
jgi:hypothetical protein